MSDQGIQIAIDGPAASGKGTVARAVAQHLGYRYLDTGAMYRAVALQVDRLGLDWTDEAAVGPVAEELDLDFRWSGGEPRVLLQGADVSLAIRTHRVGEGASAVAVHPRVRRAMVALQQRLAASGGVVVDGRDIGTVVLPGAELKIFLDADLGERARRRTDELVERGQDADLDHVRDALAARDHQDSTRAVGPLRAAQDAVHLDTTGLDIDQVVQRVLQLAVQRGAELAAAAAAAASPPA